MNRFFPFRLKNMCSTLKNIHPVDKSLLIFMFILLAQSICSIFFSTGTNHISDEIDVIIRTSTAAIFGYFLSANFIRHSSTDGQAPTEQTTHILKTGTDSQAQAAASKGQIGFLDSSTQAQPNQNRFKNLLSPSKPILGTSISEPGPSVSSGDTATGIDLIENPTQTNTVQDLPKVPVASTASFSCLQVTIATAIGLFCLIALLILRNLSQLGMISSESDSIAATVIQFRDFISGCIGFLIGCPTNQTNQTL